MGARTQKSGGPKGGGPKSGGPERVGARRGGGPKISRFSCSLPPGISFVFLSLWGFLVEFWWCLKRRDAQMCAFGVLWLSCEAPAARSGGAAGVSHDNQRAQTCTFEGPGLQKHHQNSTRRPPREGRKEGNFRWERVKKERNFGRSKGRAFRRRGVRGREPEHTHHTQTTGTNRHQQAPTGNNRHQQATTGNQQATTGNNRQQQATTGNNRQQQATTGNNQEQPGTTTTTSNNNNKQQTTTKNNNKNNDNNNNNRKFGQRIKTPKLAKCGLAKCGQHFETLILAKFGLAKCGHENKLAKFGFFGQMRFGPNAVWPKCGHDLTNCCNDTWKDVSSFVTSSMRPAQISCLFW